MGYFGFVFRLFIIYLCFCSNVKGLIFYTGWVLVGNGGCILLFLISIYSSGKLWSWSNFVQISAVVSKSIVFDM